MSSLRFYDALRALREWHPADSPVWVRRCRLTGCYGTTQWGTGRFLITIDSALPESDQVHTLLHEWAHVLTWDESEEDHDEVWSAAYSRIYQDLVEL